MPLGIIKQACVTPEAAWGHLGAVHSKLSLPATMKCACAVQVDVHGGRVHPQLLPAELFGYVMAM